MKTLLIRYAHLLALALMVAWNGALVWGRCQFSGRFYFLFFAWNLLLAIIPYLASETAVYFSGRKWNMPALGCLLFAILFLPNSPYMITDLFHLRQRAEMPFWYDTMLIFSMAVSGLVLFYAALFNIRALLMRWLSGFWAELLVSLISFACAFGIYLGRYLRFNSWDLVYNPDSLLEGIADNLSKTRSVGVTLLYGAFLLVGYWVTRLLKEQSKAIA